MLIQLPDGNWVNPGKVSMVGVARDAEERFVVLVVVDGTTINMYPGGEPEAKNISNEVAMMVNDASQVQTVLHGVKEETNDEYFAKIRAFKTVGGKDA